MTKPGTPRYRLTCQRLREVCELIDALTWGPLTDQQRADAEATLCIPTGHPQQSMPLTKLLPVG